MTTKKQLFTLDRTAFVSKKVRIASQLKLIVDAINDGATDDAIYNTLEGQTLSMIQDVSLDKNTVEFFVLVQDMAREGNLVLIVKTATAASTEKAKPIEWLYNKLPNVINAYKQFNGLGLKVKLSSK